MNAKKQRKLLKAANYLKTKAQWRELAGGPRAASLAAIGSAISATLLSPTENSTFALPEELTTPTGLVDLSEVEILPDGELDITPFAEALDKAELKVLSAEEAKALDITTLEPVRFKTYGIIGTGAD